MSPPEATRPKTRSNTLRQVASTLFAFTTIVPLMIFVWTLYRLDALSKLEFQVDLGLALGIALLGFYIFRQSIRTRLTIVLPRRSSYGTRISAPRPAE